MQPRRRVLWILAGAVAVGVGAWLALHRRPAGHRTIVLVTVDTLRRDRVGVYGAKTVTTPRMDEIARDGIRFDDARTPAPLTLPAHATILTGLSPARHGVRVNHAAPVPPRAARTFPLLAERLAERDRRCGAFVSAGPLASGFGLAQGFEVYDDEGLEDANGLAYAERRGTDTVGRALAWVRRLPKDAPAFLWVHLFEPHAPHEAGGALGYDADVALADGAVGMLLDGLASAGRGDAVVCLTADHGEALGELGEDSHGWLLGESVLRVPFLLRVPGGPKGVVRTDPVDLADVAPTLLRLAGVDEGDATREASRGIDLLASEAPPGRVRVAETTYAWQQFRWAQLVAATGSGWKLEDRGASRERLIRLSRDAAPYQGSDESAAGRAEALPLADALREYRRERAGGTVSRPAGQAPTGYLAGGPIGDLLEPKANAALPDPYAVISDAAALLQLHHQAGSPNGAALLSRLEPLSKRDPKNPFAALVRGLILTSLRRVPEAALAYREALDLGRLEPGTVLLAAGAAAEGDPKAGLAVLRGYPVAPDTQVLLLEARLCLATGDAEGAQRACRGARSAARSARDRARVEAESGCR